MRKKIIYLEAKVKGNYEHIADIEKDLPFQEEELL